MYPRPKEQLMRRSIRLSVATVATAAFAALTLTGCGTGEETNGAEPTPDASPTEEAPEEPGAGPGEDVLVVWADANRVQPVRTAAERFTADTDIPVEVVEVNFGDIGPNFITQVPLGEGPDIMLTAHDGLGGLMAAGVVAPITLGDVAGEFAQSAIDACTWEGQLFCVPVSVENIALIRNTELAPEAPATWDDMIAAGEAAGTEFPMLMQVTPEGDPFHMYPLQTSFGAPVFIQDADGSYTDELGMTGEAGEAFAAWLREQGEAGNLSTDIDSAIAMEEFGNGNSPFLISGPWALTQAGIPDIEDQLAVDPIPSAGGQQAQPFVGVQGFFLSSRSEHALDAMLFMTDFLASYDVQVELAVADNRVPARLDAAETALAGNDLMFGFSAVGETGVPMPAIPAMSQVWQFWGVTQAQIIEGTVDPAAAWNQMNEDILEAIG